VGCHIIRPTDSTGAHPRQLPSLFCSMNLDSSLNQTRLQFCRSQPLTLLHHRTLASRCRRLSTAPKYDTTHATRNEPP
jgi:hypothetical protein